MSHPISRRSLLLTAPAGLAALGVAALPRRSAAQAPASTSAPGVPSPAALGAFPSQDPALVRKAVGLSHRDLDGLRKLVDPMPELAKATYDWGFGDWETCIGASSHVGNRDITAYLIAKGARPDLFTFAMLGNLDAVRAIIAANPGVQRLHGPHGITLYRHAVNGGDAAKPVADYLLSLGDADQTYSDLPLSEELEAVYTGVYSFGLSETDHLNFTRQRLGFSIDRAGDSPRRLFHLGDHQFHPVGAPSVRVRFTIESGRAVSVGVHNPDLLLTAMRVDC